MSFFNKIKEFGAQAADVAKDAAEIGKYRLKIAEAEGEFKSTILEVANKLFEEHPETLEQLFPQEFAKLKDLKSTVASFKEQIEAVKGDTEEDEVVADASPVDETPANE